MENKLKDINITKEKLNSLNELINDVKVLRDKYNNLIFKLYNYHDIHIKKSLGYKCNYFLNGIYTFKNMEERKLNKLMKSYDKNKTIKSLKKDSIYKYTPLNKDLVNIVCSYI